MEVFKLTSSFPAVEKFSMVDQIRRSSRSVCANIAEAWRKRRYRAAFIAKLTDAEAEANETRTWIDFSVRCGYLENSFGLDFDRRYNMILGQLTTIIKTVDSWLLSKQK